MCVGAVKEALAPPPPPPRQHGPQPPTVPLELRRAVQPALLFGRLGCLHMCVWGGGHVAAVCGVVGDGAAVFVKRALVAGGTAAGVTGG